MMLDFERLAELTFIIFVLQEEVVFDNGIVLDKNNFAVLMSFHFAA